jgi:hypothetical protein
MADVLRQFISVLKKKAAELTNRNSSRGADEHDLMGRLFMRGRAEVCYSYELQREKPRSLQMTNGIVGLVVFYSTVTSNTPKNLLFGESPPNSYEAPPSQFQCSHCFQSEQQELLQLDAVVLQFWPRHFGAT